MLDQCHETLKSSAVSNKDRNPQLETRNKYNRNTTPQSYHTTRTFKRQNRRPVQKTKHCKKCPRKIDVGMPQFEHFPVKEILKEGIDNNDCQDASYSGADDFDLNVGDDLENDYDDYVQPTKNP